ncbi:MAG: sterol desaturase family protein, partial [Chitinivibrionales bacterium]|nr:sterol desaturase family protein [Chitinivibrionales bacterium]
MNETITEITPATLTLLAAVAVVLFMLQELFPLRRRTNPFVHRLFVNAVLSGLALGTSALIVTPVAGGILSLVTKRQIGFLRLFDLPPVAETFLAFLLMDATFYWWHRVNHQIAFLWRFHNVHHIDPDLDVTTSFRFHAGEIALSAGFRAVQILLIGISSVNFVLYQLVFNVSTMFHHSNIRLPIGVERLLNLLVVTPRMHGIHHSNYREETNSNYSVVFRWWDMLWRTLHLGVHQSAVEIGVPGYRDPTDNRLRHAVVMPFVDQRDYWRGREH